MVSYRVLTQKAQTHECELALFRLDGSSYVFSRDTEAASLRIKIGRTILDDKTIFHNNECELGIFWVRRK